RVRNYYALLVTHYFRLFRPTDSDFRVPNSQFSAYRTYCLYASTFAVGGGTLVSMLTLATLVALALTASLAPKVVSTEPPAPKSIAPFTFTKALVVMPELLSEPPTQEMPLTVRSRGEVEGKSGPR